MAAYKALSDASIRWSWQTKDEFIHNIRQKNCLALQGTSICLPERRDPVIHVSWNDAKAYCEWLSEKSGQTYRLPTEAEWEYAAGNGAKHTKYSWGNGQPYGKKAGNLADETGAEAFNCNKTADSIFLGYDDGYKSTAPVGSFLPNDIDLYDMTGNVWEWCSDWKGDYSSGIQTNPQGPSMGSGRVFRGGSWGDSPLYCRVAGRDDGAPHGRVSIVGFRIARTK